MNVYECIWFRKGDVVVVIIIFLWSLRMMLWGGISGWDYREKELDDAAEGGVWVRGWGDAVEE